MGPGPDQLRFAFLSTIISHPTGNVLLTSAPTIDGWLVDGSMAARSDVKFLDRLGKLVNVRFMGYDGRGTTTALRIPEEVIDVEASPPVLQLIYGALQMQTESQKAALDESKAIFKHVEEVMHTKLGDMEGKVDALQQSRAETTTALLEQKDSIEQLQAQQETNSDEFCQMKEARDLHDSLTGLVPSV